MWFSLYIPELPRVRPVPGDTFILKEPNEHVLVVNRGRVIGWCDRKEVWRSAIIAEDGPMALERLGLIKVGWGRRK